MKNTIYIFFILILIAGCNSEKNKRNIPNWKELNCGLWINPQGELGFKSEEAYGDGGFRDIYLTNIGTNDSTTLNDIIDTNTFHQIGGDFYKDKNRIYCHYLNSDGGYLNVWDVDYNSFIALGDCYAKDKDHIYFSQRGKLDSVDYKTFKTAEGIGCFAKDKNGYIFWNKRMNEDEPGAKDKIEEIDKATNSY